MLRIREATALYTLLHTGRPLLPPRHETSRIPCHESHARAQGRVCQGQFSSTHHEPPSFMKFRFCR